MIKVGLTRLLRERGLSQRELARRTDKHHDVISRFARGDTQAVSYELLDSICAVLECQIGDLLEYVPDHDEQILLFESVTGAYVHDESRELRRVAEASSSYETSEDPQH